jgi:acetyl esterase/lipase
MIGLSLSAALLAAATPAIVQQAGAHVMVAGPTISRSLTYGSEPRQGLELFTRGKERAPLIVYLHGGGWSAGSPKDGGRGAQPDHWTSRGYAYATIAYRYVPAVTAEDQLRDVAKAIAFLRRQSGVDGRRIVLMGHSSGATMAAQLGTDPRWVTEAKVPFAALKGVVLLDPAVLDIPPLMATGSPALDRHFRPAFGDDPVRQSALSPMKHVEPPNAPAWLVLADAANGFAVGQGADFVSGLIGAGAEARSVPIAGTTHMRLNSEIGRPNDRATAEIDAFLGRLLPEMQRPRFR